MGPAAPPLIPLYAGRPSILPDTRLAEANCSAPRLTHAEPADRVPSPPPLRTTGHRRVKKEAESLSLRPVVCTTRSTRRPSRPAGPPRSIGDLLGPQLASGTPGRLQWGFRGLQWGSRGLQWPLCSTALPSHARSPRLAARTVQCSSGRGWPAGKAIDPAPLVGTLCCGTAAKLVSRLYSLSCV
jgi:hypothetical protein